MKWATCHVGASSPEESGDYFAWGETRPKNEYTWENYRFRVHGNSWGNVTFNKYNTESKHGRVDNKTQLDDSDDAARANWGGSWRMPSDAEWTELRTECTWTWTTQGGKNGYKVTSKTNGNSIFLPAAGRWVDANLRDVGADGYYRSSSLDTDYPHGAFYVYFSSRGIYRAAYRCTGYSIRPVTE